MINRILSITLLIFSISSCSWNGYSKSRESRLSNTEHKKANSIVITKTIIKLAREGGKLRNFGNPNFGKIEWCNIEETKCKNPFYISPYIYKEFDSEYNAYSLKAGYYFLNQIKQFQNRDIAFFPFFIAASAFGGFVSTNPKFNTSLSGWNKELNASNFISFETEDNEIVYIGDLYFTFTKQKYWVRGKINLDVQDNYDEAVKYFREKFPEYKNKPVVKRLAQPGVMLDNYDAGIFW